jgi:hypothetical protein
MKAPIRGRAGSDSGYHQEHQQQKSPAKVGRTWGKMARFDMRNGRRKNAKTTLYLYLRITLNKKAWLQIPPNPLYIKASWLFIGYEKRVKKFANKNP